MFGLFKKKSGKTKFVAAQRRDPERYEREKEIARSADLKKRLTLAGSSKTHQEILYYLAEKDPDPAVRQAVAQNAATPLHSAQLLARDQDIDVRLALAERLVDLLPELDEQKQSQLYAFAVQALGTLALDEVLKVRKALASTLKDHAHAPPKVAGQLARDVEREVAEPILRFCTALGDDDLLDILKGHPAGWAVKAIAARAQVSAPVSEAVIDSGDVPAGAVLIGNEGADISGTLLARIVEKARNCPEWQGPIAAREGLPVEMAKILAEFIDERVRQVLLARGDFDPQTTAEIAAIVRRRIDFENEDKGSGQSALERARRMAAEDRLNEEALCDALAMRDKAFVVAGIALLAKVDLAGVEKIFDIKAPKSIVAIAWKAGLSMRTALQLQKQLGHVQPKELINPKGGTDYPLSEEDMKWQLEFLGLDAA